MNRRYLIALVAGCGLIGGGIIMGRYLHSRAAWRKAVPSVPDVSAKNGELQSRIAEVYARAQGGPENAAAVTELVYLFLANGFNPEAEQGLRLLADLMPKDPRWPHLLARQLAGFGRLEDALPWHARAAALAPEYAPARLKWADALLRRNETQAAAGLYQSVLEQDAYQVFALYGLARIDFETGQLEAARARLDRAIAIDSSFATAYSLLAAILEQQGATAQAAAAQSRGNERGISREADDPWVDAIVGYCYDPYTLRVAASSLALTRRMPAALALLERALTLDPRDARTPRQLGRLYVEMHAPEKARAQFAQAIRLEPHEPSAYLALVNLLKADNDLDGGLRLLADGLRGCPESGALHLEYARALVAADRTREALPHFLEAQRLRPENLSAFHEYAIVCFRLGREKEGRIVLEKILADEPQYGPALSWLSRYYIRAGDQSAATKFIQRAQRAEEPDAVLSELRELFDQRFGGTAAGPVPGSP